MFFLRRVPLFSVFRNGRPTAFPSNHLTSRRTFSAAFRDYQVVLSRLTVYREGAGPRRFYNSFSYVTRQAHYVSGRSIRAANNGGGHVPQWFRDLLAMFVPSCTTAAGVTARAGY